MKKIVRNWYRRLPKKEQRQLLLTIVVVLLTVLILFSFWFSQTQVRGRLDTDMIDDPQAQFVAEDGLRVMAGNITYLIVPVRCSSENFSSSELEQARSSIMQGLQENWVDQSGNVKLAFYDHVFSPIHVSICPVSRPYTDQSIWIKEAIDSQGFTGSDIHQQVREFNNYWQQVYGHDETVTLFLVKGDWDNKFADGRFAYAYNNGEFGVMVVPPNAWGWDGIGQVAAHETGHLFGALDQYGSAECEWTSGVLRYTNYSHLAKNLDARTGPGCRIPQEDGIMNMAGVGPTKSTRNQIGWSDALRYNSETHSWEEGSDGFPDVFGSPRLTSWNDQGEIIQGRIVIEPFSGNLSDLSASNPIEQVLFRGSSGKTYFATIQHQPDGLMFEVSGVGKETTLWVDFQTSAAIWKLTARWNMPYTVFLPIISRP